MPAMAVQFSLARCFRASSSTTFLRPTPQALPIRGQLFQFYQKSGYATNNPSDASKSNETTSTGSQGVSTNSNSPSSPAASGNVDSTADETKLAEKMADIRDKMKELSRPVDLSRGTRKFFRNLSESDVNRPQRTAEEQLDKLLTRRQPRHQQQERAQSQRPNSSFSQSSSSASTIHHLETPATPPRLRPVNMKLGTKLGRQIFVQNDKGVDCASAIRMLQITCSTNGVRRQANLQKFHIRRGQRRKDLKSQRWRKLFKFSFDETVKKIQRMRDQGW